MSIAPYSNTALSEPGALAAAAAWIESLVLGTPATITAVLAIAALGFAALGGHFPARRALRVVLGTFILFGAPIIAGGLSNLSQQWRQGTDFPTAVASPVDPAPAAPLPSPTANPFDPYAGASVPM